MKIRSDLLASCAAALLGAATLCEVLPVTVALAADQMPVKAAPVENVSGWYWNGLLEAGYNFFIQKPGDGFGKTSVDPFWLTPNTTNSSAKLDEYGRVPRGAFLDVFGFNAGSRDGRYGVDFWADNVGYDNQRYDLRIYESGRQYFNIGWDQTPHLLSTSAKSIFGAVGSTRLTVDPASRTFLQSQVFPLNNQPQRNAIESYIDGPAPINNIELKTLREKFAVGYRNTMVDNWDFTVDYSNEHRTGTRPLGIGYGIGATANPRPSSGAVEVPQPLDDRTQIANAAGEYVGTTPWGTRWNTQVKYAGSFYNNNNKSMDVDNPFCITCSAVGPAPFGPNTLRYGLYPDNSANGVTWNNAVDIPIFKTRYTSNMQYMMFRQNDAFISDAGINGITVGPAANQLNPYPASSLNGEVNAFLTNNVFYSHLTQDLTNTARVRYYDRRDNTPTLAFNNYAYADGGFATTTPLTREPQSYSKLDLADDLKWQLNRAWTLGAGYFFERYVYQNGEVNSTNEPGVKAFVNWTPWSYVTARSSLQYSQRRYDTWLATSTDPAAAAMRFFFVQNRNRFSGNTIMELGVFKNVTLSPNGGFRWDDYPTDTVINALALPTNSLGTQYDHSWNAGADLGVRVTPHLHFKLGYNYEEHFLYMQSCCGGASATVPFTPADVWSSKITKQYNTFVGSVLWNAIPGTLDFKADYVVSVSNEANDTTPCSSLIVSCTGANSSTPTVMPVWPDEHNIFQRLDLVAKYYVDPSFVKRMGWFGQVTAKLRYTWQKNSNTNWATDNFTPYSPSSADAGGVDISNGGRSLFLAYNNPNYSAQIISASIVLNW